jgi:hypothetical protein
LLAYVAPLFEDEAATVDQSWQIASVRPLFVEQSGEPYIQEVCDRRSMTNAVSMLMSGGRFRRARKPRGTGDSSANGHFVYVRNPLYSGPRCIQPAMAVNACTIAGRKIKGAVEEAGALNFLLL